MSGMEAHERIMDGIKRGVDRHWRFTKNLLRIKPEYLLTVSVADALTDGFNNICGLDLEIKLEEPTRAISTDLLLAAVGWRNFFKSIVAPVTRRGKVDIYVTHNADSWIIELKGFDPSAAEIQKDLVRLQEFLAANGGNHKCRGCFLGFPTATDRSVWIKQQLDGSQSVGVVYSERVETQEDPEDGLPVYYANCIALSYANVQPTT